MEQNEDSKIPSTNKDESHPTMPDEFQELLQKLEKQTNWDGRLLVKYGGFWCPNNALRPILSSQKFLKANDTDIFLATMPKSGTTWLKALTFCIANRETIHQSPLLTSNPHEIVPFLEFSIYWEQQNPDLQHFPSPRIFATHMPFKSLPASIFESECKIIYICRNPLDQFVSHRHFLLENRLEKDAVPLELDESFDMFCRGIHPFGPFWEHMLGYWNAHLENPKKVLFLRYEDLKEDIAFNVKKVADFLGFPLSEEEEKMGLIDKISSLCSFEKLSSLDVNKIGHTSVIKNSSYFRKGEVGDWTNYLTTAMAERMRKIVETQLDGSGLTFEI